MNSTKRFLDRKKNGMLLACISLEYTFRDPII